MKLNELSNPNTISDKFALVRTTPESRTYKNVETGSLLKCYMSGYQYIFSYDDKFSIQKHTDNTLSLSIFKTVLYDVKTNIIGYPFFYFTASGDEPSRVKLYSVMLKLLLKLGYQRVEDSTELRKHVANEDSWFAGLRIFAKSRAKNEELYAIVKINTLVEIK